MREFRFKIFKLPFPPSPTPINFVGRASNYQFLRHKDFLLTARSCDATSEANTISAFLFRGGGGMERALPYRIPGPAGGISTQQQTENATPQKPILDLFRTASWRQMLNHLNRKIPSSIALLRRNALSNDFAKLTTLPVLIDSLAYVGKDASVLLRDPTGHVRGTIHAEVFKERKGMLERGVVILLNGVSALAYLEESRGFRGGDDIVHLSVQACHVSEVFKSGDALPPNSSSRSILDDYEPQAKRPKPVVKPSITCLPLRERNYPRPISRGFQSGPRGGATGQGRGQHSYAPPHPRPSSQFRMHQHHPRYRRQDQQFQRQHNPNYPPHCENMSHRRPMLGLNQHKRPFRPPGMRSNATEAAMPPPEKRPYAQQIHQPYRQPPQQSNTVGAITDDQLDSLLGDLDVDAMIAAHGKSASLPGQSSSSEAQSQPFDREKSTPPTLSEREQEKLEVSTCTAQTDNTDPSSAKSRTSGDPAAVPIPTTGKNPIKNGAAHVQAAMNIPGPRISAHGTNSVAQKTLPQQADHLTISNVDPDMVNNLFEGIDATEYM